MRASGPLERDVRRRAARSRRVSMARNHDDLLDYLICPQEQRRWDRQAQRLRGLHVEHELEPCWLLDWKIARVGSFEDSVDVFSGAAEHVREVHAVSDEPTSVRVLAETEARR